jgi:CubicO group peptidase (beta-lactamase class C family)
MKRPGLLLLLVALVAPAGGAAPQIMSGSGPGPAAEQVAPVIEKYRQVIREQMKAQRIPGIAIALVTGDDVLWSEGFGCTDRSCRNPVTVATPFSIQSMSKAVTATAVMLAVQDGVLDLDTPISVYLPGFTVRSVFDERPQGLITLRMLLSHTAGFDHEAPVGNNYDPEPGSWEEHVASISRTYLRFPVGRHWAYSNLGIDLAGAALERKTDVPFHEYVERWVFAPLGMASSTMDRAAILAMPHRAVGHESIFRDIPVVPMMASGGCYTTASDLAAFVRFHLNRGAAGGVTLLDPALLEILYAPQFPASAPHNYGLGLVARPSPRGVLEVSHSGGGFGFLSQMKWYPALGLGVAWVSNSTGHDLQSWLTDAILGDVIAAAGDILSPVVTAHPYVERPLPTAPDAIAGDTLAAWIRSLAMDGGPDAHRRRGGYAGTYGLPVWGRVVELVRIAGHSPLTLDGRPLYEVRPGLYLSESGEALDLTTGTATWRNIPLVDLDRSRRAQIALMAVCAVVLLGAIPWAIASSMTGRRMRRRGPVPGRVAVAEPILRSTLVLGALLALTAVGMLAQFPFLMFGRVPLPHGGLPPIQQAGLAIPYLVAGLVVPSTAGVVVVWRRRLGPRWSRIWATITLVALAVFSVLLLT